MPKIIQSGIRPRYMHVFASRGRSVLISSLNGMVESASDGLFFNETRILSRYRYILNGHPCELVAGANVEQHSWLGYYIQHPSVTHSKGLAEAAQEAIELKVGRYVAQGMHEDIDVTNFTQTSIDIDLLLEFDADFHDQRRMDEKISELTISRQQHETGDWAPGISFECTAERQYNEQGNEGIAYFHRGVTLCFTGAKPEFDKRGVRFTFKLEPKQTWHICVRFIPSVNGERFEPLYDCNAYFTDAGASIDGVDFLQSSTTFSSDHSLSLGHIAVQAAEQAKRDLDSLRLEDLTHDSGWIVAAGIPVYTALFGRDTLTAAWQAALATPNMMRGTLRELARLQGKQQNDWLDEQPGRMIHEVHTGPLASLKYNPEFRSYSSVTTSGFYPVVLSEYWHWTGDKEFVKRYVDNALSALHYLDTHGDLDQDGLYEYKTRSKDGSKNQAWKDSEDAVVYEDGSQAQAPIATCEEQAYVYLAKLQVSELLWWLDRKDEAKQLFHQAQELKKRFNDAFWMPEQNYLAFALDSEKRQIKSIVSNPGHCLAAGIVDSALVKPVADRMFEDDLFSGWGIRTLSSEHPAYNPYSYHRGSVWPVEQGTFALGCVRYGFWDHLERLVRAQFEAAAWFSGYRLPEVFSGHPRDAHHPFPGLYPNTCSPQAWSSSAVLCMLQSLLSLYPYAPLQALFIDPHLPEWLPSLTVEDLRVGDSRITLRFLRRPDGKTDYDILRMDGNLRVIRQPSPWSLVAGPMERFVDLVGSLAH